jgi:hypothetical protein
MLYKPIHLKIFIMISRLAYSLLVGTSLAKSVEIYKDNEYDLADYKGQTELDLT